MTEFLHVANGTSTTRTIHDAGIPGRSSIWADVLYDGPVPADLDDEQLLELRAGVIGGDEHSVEAVAAELRQWRAAIDDTGAYDELVLWYEHDLFDQLNLIQLLSRVSPEWPKPVTLICIGSFPGRPHFKGLGELTASELGPLFASRLPVTPAQLALAQRAWAAFRSSSPTAIEALLAADTSSLPYLASALGRFLEEFPSTRDGLSRTEHRLLTLAAEGPVALVEAFPRMHEDETAYYVTDLSFLSLVRELSSPSVPLLSLEAPADRLRGKIALTDAGREVLAGTDRVTRYGLDRWLGGVHLSASTPMWRWDPAKERVVQT